MKKYYSQFDVVAKPSVTNTHLLQGQYFIYLLFKEKSFDTGQLTPHKLVST